MKATYENEIQILFDFSQNNVCSATMATAATGIVQKNICRHKRDLEKMGLLYVVDHRKCSVTGFKVDFITCNPSLFPKVTNNQLNLF